jgi:hypothetical protein
MPSSQTYIFLRSTVRKATAFRIIMLIPLSIITQNNGHKAIIEVEEVLFSGIPTSQEHALSARGFSSLFTHREPTSGSSEVDEDSSEWDSLLEVMD